MRTRALPATLSSIGLCALCAVAAHAATPEDPPLPRAGAWSHILPVEAGLAPVHEELAAVTERGRQLRLALEDSSLDAARAQGLRAALEDVQRREAALREQIATARARARNPLVTHLAPA